MDTSRWSIYLVRTATGALYAGISTDPARRLRQHQSGKGARALRGKGPLTLVWQQVVGDKGTALRLEYRLKQQRKIFKEQLVREPRRWEEWLVASTAESGLSRTTGQDAPTGGQR